MSAPSPTIGLLLRITTFLVCFSGFVLALVLLGGTNFAHAADDITNLDYHCDSPGGCTTAIPDPCSNLWYNLTSDNSCFADDYINSPLPPDDFSVSCSPGGDRASLSFRGNLDSITSSLSGDNDMDWVIRYNNETNGWNEYGPPINYLDGWTDDVQASPNGSCNSWSTGDTSTRCNFDFSTEPLDPYSVWGNWRGLIEAGGGAAYEIYWGNAGLRPSSGASRFVCSPDYEAVAQFINSTLVKDFPSGTALTFSGRILNNGLADYDGKNASAATQVRYVIEVDEGRNGSIDRVVKDAKVSLADGASLGVSGSYTPPDGLHRWRVRVDVDEAHTEVTYGAPIPPSAESNNDSGWKDFCVGAACSGGGGGGAVSPSVLIEWSKDGGITWQSSNGSFNDGQTVHIRTSGTNLSTCTESDNAVADTGFAITGVTGTDTGITESNISTTGTTFSVSCNSGAATDSVVITRNVGGGGTPRCTNLTETPSGMVDPGDQVTLTAIVDGDTSGYRSEWVRGGSLSSDPTFSTQRTFTFNTTQTVEYRILNSSNLVVSSCTATIDVNTPPPPSLSMSWRPDSSTLFVGGDGIISHDQNTIQLRYYANNVSSCSDNTLSWETSGDTGGAWVIDSSVDAPAQGDSALYKIDCIGDNGSTISRNILIYRNTPPPQCDAVTASPSMVHYGDGITVTGQTTGQLDGYQAVWRRYNNSGTREATLSATVDYTNDVVQPLVNVPGAFGGVVSRGVYYELELFQASTGETITCPVSTQVAVENLNPPEEAILAWKELDKVVYTIRDDQVVPMADDFIDMGVSVDFAEECIFERGTSNQRIIPMQNKINEIAYINDVAAPPVGGSYTYTIECSNANGSVSNGTDGDSVDTIRVLRGAPTAPAPTVDLQWTAQDGLLPVDTDDITELDAYSLSTTNGVVPYDDDTIYLAHYTQNAQTCRWSMNPGDFLTTQPDPVDVGPGGPAMGPGLRGVPGIAAPAPGTSRSYTVECFGRPGDGYAPVSETITLVRETATECDDGIDQSGDGLVDWDGDGVASLADPDCSGPTDDTEDPVADLEAINVDPDNLNNSFSQGVAIPFEGRIRNNGPETLTTPVYADLHIVPQVGGVPGTSITNYNAHPTLANGTFNNMTSGELRVLSETLPAGSLAPGIYYYRFHVDTDDRNKFEPDEDNNYSPWQIFEVQTTADPVVSLTVTDLDTGGSVVANGGQNRILEVYPGDRVLVEYTATSPVGISNCPTASGFPYTPGVFSGTHTFVADATSGPIAYECIDTLGVNTGEANVVINLAVPTDCSDNADNDGDLLEDFDGNGGAPDPGCRSFEDDTEYENADLEAINNYPQATDSPFLEGDSVTFSGWMRNNGPEDQVTGVYTDIEFDYNFDGNADAGQNFNVIGNGKINNVAAGTQRAISYTKTLGASSFQYRFHVDTNGLLPEVNTANNQSPWIRVDVQPGVPPLACTSFTVSPPSPVAAGTPITLSWTTTGTPWVNVGTMMYGTDVANNATGTDSVTITPTAATTYYLWAFDGSGNQCFDQLTVNVTNVGPCSDTIDNDGDSVTDMADPGCTVGPDEFGPVDLEAITLSPADGSTTTSGSNITFTGQLRNNGPDNQIVAVWADLEIDLNQNGTIDPGENFNAHGGTMINGVGVGGTEPLSFTGLSSIAPGTYQYRFNVDTNNLLAEPDENNNTSPWRSITVTAPALGPCEDGVDNDGDTRTDMNDPGCTVGPDEFGPVDLEAISSLPFDGSTIVGGGGTDITFTGQLRNNGPDIQIVAVWADLEIDLNQNGTIDPGENFNAHGGTMVNGVWPGSAEPLSFTGLSSIAPGTYQFRFNVDTNNLLAEPDETNNVSPWWTVTINAPGANCGDYGDNDGDGLIDSADPDCHTDGNPYDGDGSHDVNLIEDGADTCHDNLDNGGDGFADAFDTECHTDGSVDTAAPATEQSYDGRRNEVDLGSAPNCSSLTVSPGNPTPSDAITIAAVTTGQLDGYAAQWTVDGINYTTSIDSAADTVEDLVLPAGTIATDETVSLSLTHPSRASVVCPSETINFDAGAVDLTVGLNFNSSNVNQGDTLNFQVTVENNGAPTFEPRDVTLRITNSDTLTYDEVLVGTVPSGSTDTYFNNFSYNWDVPITGLTSQPYSAYAKVEAHSGEVNTANNETSPRAFDADPVAVPTAELEICAEGGFNDSTCVGHTDSGPLWIAEGDTIRIIWNGNSAISCNGAGKGFNTGGQPVGSIPVNSLTAGDDPETYTLTCTNAAGASAPVSVIVRVGTACADSGIIEAPGLVRAGDEFLLKWQKPLDVMSCTLTGSTLNETTVNTPTTDGTDFGCTEVEEFPVSLENRTQFTLTCDGGPDPVDARTVDVIPRIEEI